MGEYMDVWSRIENIVRLAIKEMLEIDELPMRAIASAMATKQTIDLFEAAANLTLTKAGSVKAKKLYESLINRNRRRNNIVHGAWNCHVLDPSTGEALWLRKYDAMDAAISALPFDHPKVAGLYSFTVAELSETTGHAERIVASLADFISEIPALKLQPIGSAPS